MAHDAPKFKTIEDLVKHAHSVTKVSPFEDRIAVLDSLYHPDVDLGSIINTQIKNFVRSDESIDTAYYAVVKKMGDVLDGGKVEKESQIEILLEEYLDFFLERALPILGSKHIKKADSEKDGDEGRYERLKRKTELYDKIAPPGQGKPGLSSIFLHKEGLKHYVGKTTEEMKSFFTEIADEAIKSHSDYITSHIEDHLLGPYDQAVFAKYATKAINDAGYQFKDSPESQPVHVTKQAYILARKDLWDKVQAGTREKLGLQKYQAKHE